MALAAVWNRIRPVQGYAKVVGTNQTRNENNARRDLPVESPGCFLTALRKRFASCLSMREKIATVLRAAWERVV